MPATDSPSTSPTLLRLLQDLGNEAAWAHFVALYGPLILQHARHAGLQPADAEEVKSRVLGGLVAALPGFTYDPAKRFRGYLAACVHNALRNLARERRRHPDAVATAHPEDAARLAAEPDRAPFPGLAEELDDRLRDDLRRLHEVLEVIRARVEPTSWQAYWRTAVENRAAEVVAAELGISRAAVYMAKSRVGRQLREAADAPPPGDSV